MITLNHHRSTYYHNTCCDLAKSLTLKSLATAFIMNGEVEAYCIQHNLPPLFQREDQTTWRYICHLAGEYHPYDLHRFGYIKVKSLDTLQIIDFTQETLKRHRATAQHYQMQGEYYWALVKQYPDLHILIDGICRPVNKQKAIEAKEYDILSYREDLVETQENYLIPTLAKQIKNSLLAFDSHNYSVYLEGYEMMKLAYLGAHLPGMIVAIREQYVGTPFAHSFHIWNYLASKFALDKYRPYLTFKQAIWIYRHLRYIDINAGRTKTFDELVDVLLTDRNIPLYGFDIDNLPGAIHVGRDQLNLKDRTFTVDDSELDIANLYDKESDQARRNTEFRSSGLDLMNGLMEKNTNDCRRTKVLESIMYDHSSRERYPLGGIALNYWAWMAFTNRYELKGSMTNPLTGDMLTLTAREGFILWYYLANRLINPYDKPYVTNMKIPTFTAWGILDEQLDWQEIKYQWVNQKINLRDYLEEMEQQVPYVMPVATTTQFRQLVENIQTYRLYLRHLESAYDGLHGATEIEHVHARIFHKYNLVLSDDQEMTFGKWLTEKNWHFDTLDRESCFVLAGRLYGYFTGIDLEDNTNALEEMQKAMLSIFRQLSSYTIQFTSKTYGKDSTIVDTPIVRWDNDKTTEASKVSYLNRNNAKWKNETAKEKGLIDIDIGLSAEGYMDVDTWEVSTLSALQPVGLHASGAGITLREVRLHTPGWRSHSTGGFDLDHLVKNNYYLFNHTLYQWRSYYKQAQPMFEIRRGIPYTEPETP